MPHGSEDDRAATIALSLPKVDVASHHQDVVHRDQREHLRGFEAMDDRDALMATQIERPCLDCCLGVSQLPEVPGRLCPFRLQVDAISSQDLVTGVSRSIRPLDHHPADRGDIW